MAEARSEAGLPARLKSELPSIAATLKLRGAALSDPQLRGPPGPRSFCNTRHEKAQNEWPKSNPANSSVWCSLEPAQIRWATRQETIATAIMVIIMTLVLAIFFTGTDSAFGAVVQYLLSLA